jgi:hypothetical protein
MSVTPATPISLTETVLNEFSRGGNFAREEWSRQIGSSVYRGHDIDAGASVSLTVMRDTMILGYISGEKRMGKQYSEVFTVLADLFVENLRKLPLHPIDAAGSCTPSEPFYHVENRFYLRGRVPITEARAWGAAVRHIDHTAQLIDAVVSQALSSGLHSRFVPD